MRSFRSVGSKFKIVELGQKNEKSHLCGGKINHYFGKTRFLGLLCLALQLLI